MAARQQANFSPAAGGLFLQLDMLSQLELQDAVRLHTLEVEGYNSAWAEPLIRRNYAHRHISDRPYLRHALHALRQELDALSGDQNGADFRQAIGWLNESNAPLTFTLAISTLELSPCESRRAICAMRPGVLTTVGGHHLLSLRGAAPAEPLTTKQRAAAVKAARDEREALIAAETASRARAFARGAGMASTSGMGQSRCRPQAQGARSRQAGRSSTSSPAPDAIQCYQLSSETAPKKIAPRFCY